MKTFRIIGMLLLRIGLVFAAIGLIGFLLWGALYLLLY